MGAQVHSAILEHEQLLAPARPRLQPPILIPTPPRPSAPCAPPADPYPDSRLLRLPDDILVKVFLLLQPREKGARLWSLCRRLRDAIPHVRWPRIDVPSDIPGTRLPSSHVLYMFRVQIPPAPSQERYSRSPARRLYSVPSAPAASSVANWSWKLPPRAPSAASWDGRLLDVIQGPPYPPPSPHPREVPDFRRWLASVPGLARLSIRHGPLSFRYPHPPRPPPPSAPPSPIHLTLAVKIGSKDRYPAAPPVPGRGRLRPILDALRPAHSSPFAAWS
eukprot:tig00000331_g24146.t1